MSEIAVANANSKSNRFVRFDVVTDEADHHYQSNKAGSNFNSGKAAKKIMQEWKSLEENLPDTIYVRVYEKRIDLLRAVIQGPAGTPYYNGLFFFDFCFPSDYPSSPPKVNFHSHGHRLNPNLYQTGRVCLSLLNTWFGSSKERWNRNQSTILQILLSLQGLVLNEKPFFNEPGYKNQTASLVFLKKSVAYNEDVFVLSLKIMSYVMLKPPRHFEELVTEHFKKNGHAILTTCKAYLDGQAKVGELVRKELPGVTIVSTKFKTSMSVIYPKLAEMLAKMGASVESFVQELKEEKLRNLLAVIVKKPPVVPKKSDGFAKKALGLAKKIFKLNKKQIATNSVSYQKLGVSN